MLSIGNNSKSFALRLLRSFCPQHLLEEIEGDLLQKFERDVKAFGERRAKRRLVWNTIDFSDLKLFSEARNQEA